MPAADRLSSLLDPITLRLARTSLPARSREAMAALLLLLPARLRAWVEGDDQRLFLLRQGGDVALVAAGRRGDAALGTLPLDDASVLEQARERLDGSAVPRWLLLPVSQVLRRRLALPFAAESRLREVLAFELDRQTPFSADQVSYHGRVLARDPAAQQLDVELLVLPRTRLDAEVLALGTLGANLAGVDVIDSNGFRLGVNLLPEARRERRQDPVRRLNLALAAVAGVALFATLLLTLANRRDLRDDFRAKVEVATAEARQARVLRNQLQASAQAANFLAARRASRPTMLEVLDDLTRRIPDDTTLDKLVINDDNLVMVGHSSAAPALVALLQASPLLVEPALSGAVQADPRTGRDRFTLAARIAVKPSPEAADAPRP
ncbi:MAG: general secretion pathway protein GspL [Lysobacteraceae bacterium]|nr:MAG: general secretion pathway protein GspL [Xanthomonadaceae bacterium]